jgi:hypothetical protein
MADRDGIGDASSSFLRPAKLLLAGLSSAVHTRLALFVTELEEERERIKQAIVLALLAFFGLSLGVILLTIFWRHRHPRADLYRCRRRRCLAPAQENSFQTRTVPFYPRRIGQGPRPIEGIGS